MVVYSKIMTSSSLFKFKATQAIKKINTTLKEK